MLGLRTTIYRVEDIDKAKDWYAKAFQKEPYFETPDYVGFDIGGFELGLQPEDQPATNKAESVVSYWGVENIIREYDRLIALGATVVQKPTSVGGDLFTGTVKDPFGNMLGLILNPHFKIEE
jgi:predicted enzyme related to lactoylglutathione lyase